MVDQGGGRTWIPYMVGGGGGLPEALKFFVTLSDKNHSNGLQHYQSTLGVWFGKLHTYSVSNFW